MQGADELLKQLKEKIRKSSGLAVTTKTQPHHFAKDAYTVDQAGSSLVVTASSSRAHLFALSHILFATKRDSLVEAFGSHCPKYPNSTIAFMSKKKNGSLSLPDWLSLDSIPKLAEMLYHLGFGRALFGLHSSYKTHLPEDNSSDPGALFSKLAHYGIEVAIKPDAPSGCPCDPKYRSDCEKVIFSTLELLPYNGAIFWECNPFDPTFRSHKNADDLLPFDLLCQELKMVENALQGVPLIFSVACPSDEAVRQQKEWLNSFIDHLGPNSTLAFSTQEGAPWDDHKRNHPLWDQLASEKIVSGTPLQPILNIGAIHQGEALWPTVPCREIEQLFARLRRHPFCAPIALASTLPEECSFLEASLWVAGQAIWGFGSPQENLESWLSARFPDDDPLRLTQTILVARQTVIDIQSLIAEEKKHTDGKETGSKWSEYRKCQVDSLLARLNGLRSMWNLIEKKENSNRFYTSLRYFIRDAKRLVFQYLQNNNLSVANVLTGEDMLEGYWTKMESMPGKGIGSGGKVISHL